MNIDWRMQRHYFIRGGEHIYERSTSIDKDYVIVEGANHGWVRARVVPRYRQRGLQQRSDQSFHYVRDWANTRF